MLDVVLKRHERDRYLREVAILFLGNSWLESHFVGLISMCTLGHFELQWELVPDGWYTVRV
jgi:hypothetical protein